MLGYMTPGKGQDQAVPRSARSPPGAYASLCLVGPGGPSYVESLVESSKELNVADRVEIVGFVGDDRFAYFATADVALSCSELEGLPRVVVEAMKCGAAVVGTRSGGTTELITEDWNGYLYEPGDVSELAEKLDRSRRPSRDRPPGREPRGMGPHPLQPRALRHRLPRRGDRRAAPAALDGRDRPHDVVESAVASTRSADDTSTTRSRNNSARRTGSSPWGFIASSRPAGRGPGSAGPCCSDRHRRRDRRRRTAPTATGRRSRGAGCR